MRKMKDLELHHAQALIALLEAGNQCKRCVLDFYDCIYVESYIEVCSTCTHFLNQDEEWTVCDDKPMCPCNFLGPFEAVKRSWITLEEKGYLDEIHLEDIT